MISGIVSPKPFQQSIHLAYLKTTTINADYLC